MTWAPSWNEADDAWLRRLWGEEHSTGEIGKIMNRSKNAIVGRAHRLNLPSRPSPIVGRGCLDGYISDAAFVRDFTEAWNSDMTRDAVAIKFDIGRERAYALAKKLGLPMPYKRDVAAVTLPPLVSVTPARVGPPVAVGPVLRRVSSKGAPCAFPIGDPKKPDFRFCEAASAVGSNYCPEHHRRCWNPIPGKKAA